MKKLPEECGVCEHNHQEGMYLVCCHGDVQGTIDSANAPVAPMCPSSDRATWCPLEGPQIDPYSPPGSEWTPGTHTVTSSSEGLEAIMHDEMSECKQCQHYSLYRMVTDGPYTYSEDMTCLKCSRFCVLEDKFVPLSYVATTIHRTWRERKEAMSQQGGWPTVIEGLEPIEELPIGHCDITIRKKIDEIGQKVNRLMEIENGRLV